MKLATELAKRDTGKTLFILDEPTTGLHFDDIRTLLGILNKLVERGNTVLVIEHNLDMVRMADYLVDMGPAGVPAVALSWHKALRSRLPPQTLLRHVFCATRVLCRQAHDIVRV